MSGTFNLRATSGAITSTIGRFVAETAPLIIVPVTLSRVAAGSGATVCTGGVALPAGALLPGGTARLEVAGVEVAAAVEDTGMRHPDGSVSWLRVQATRTLTNGTPESATMRLRAVQALPVPFASIAWPTGTTAATWQSNVPVPGLVWNTDAATLCAAWPVAPLAPRAADPSAAASYNSAWDATALVAYNSWDGGGTDGIMQYDRPYIYACHAARTADPAWLARALAIYAGSRDRYYAPNNWFLPESQPGHNIGLIADVLWGDTLFRSRMLTTDYLVLWQFDRGNRLNNTADMTGREVSTCGLGPLLALRRLGLGSSLLTGPSVTGPLSVDALLESIVAGALASPQWQEANGRMNLSNVSLPYSFHFHTALLCFDLARAADAGVGSPAMQSSIRARVQSVMEWMWANARTPSANAFFGGTATALQDPAGDAGPTSKPDLEGFWPALAGFLIRWGLDAETWRTRGDAMLAVIGRTPRTGNAGDGPFLSGQKQWNESFYLSQHFLGMRG